MKGKFFKNYFGYQNQEKKNECCLPIPMDFLSRKLLNLEFNKLYLSSREELRAITDNPSEDMLVNINNCLKQNSKFLTNCFSEAAANQFDILDLVTERLTFEGIDYKVPNTKSTDIKGLLCSTDNPSCDNQTQPEHQ